MNSIIATGNHFVVQLKANQKKLYRSLSSATASQPPLACFQQETSARGRTEIRSAKVYDRLPCIAEDGWPAVKRIIVVERTRCLHQQKAHSTSYYLSSIDSTDAAFFAEGIRNHWLIENKLHYVKDVVLDEDRSLIRKHVPAANISLMKNTSINLMRINGFDSIKQGIAFFANKIKVMLNIMRT